MAQALLQRTSIKFLELEFDNAMLIALVIGKQQPRRLNNERSVWNFTIRDSPSDYINVTYWGNPDIVSHLNTIIDIGNQVEIIRPRVILRTFDDIGEQYRPVVTSPFYLVINEGSGSVEKVLEHCQAALMRLTHLPTKPMYNYTSIDYIFSNIHQINGSLFDILVAVRQVGDLRIVHTKNGLKEVRKVLVFDHSNPAMAISLWGSDATIRVVSWKPRETILFVTDCKVSYDTYSNSAVASLSMKSIITENPEGNEANSLKQYAKTTPLHSSILMDQIIGIMPEAAFIKTTMNVQQIGNKIRQISATNSTRLDDNQFAVILYANITQLDLDGPRVFSTRCSLCKSFVNPMKQCENPVCLSVTSNETMHIEKTFNLSLSAADRTGTLTKIRMSGTHAENILHCTPSEFEEMTDSEINAIKWRYLLEFCELRLAIFVKNKRPLITLLTCERADVSIYETGFSLRRKQKALFGNYMVSD